MKSAAEKCNQNPAKRREKIVRQRKGGRMDRNKSQDISHKSQVISRRLSVDRHLEVRLEKGTAFILVVMLVTLLAVIGTMFLLRARVGRLSASAMRQNSELNNAADTVVAAISQQLIVDTPGVDPNGEYYDYPDANNAWLANLEPYSPDGTNYYWRQVSNIFSANPIATVEATIIKDYQSNITTNLPADADGDGVADSRWIMIPDINTGRGEPVFAAVRVVDNGGMLNVNTAYKFDPNSAIQSEIDGSSQLQINLAELSQRGANGNLTVAADKLHSWRCNTSLLSYENNVIWQYNNPTVGYTPFDISDELKLRNRYLLDFNEITTRIEKLWTKAYDGGPQVSLADSSSSFGFFDWKQFATLDTLDVNAWDKYDYRHISTTYNIDRIINPFGERMVNIQNINSTPNILMSYNDAQNLYYTMLLPCLKDIPAGSFRTTLEGEFAQIAANIKDYSDNDTKVTTVIDWQKNPHYGYERPEIRISEIVYGDRYLDPNNLRYDPCDPNCSTKYLHRSYAIEISNDFRKNEDFNDWRLVIDTPSSGFNAIWPISSGLFDESGGRFYVRIFQDPCAPLSDSVYWLDSPADGAKGVDPNVILRWGEIWGRDINGNWIRANAYDVYFGTDPEPAYQGRQTGNAFDPLGSAPMAKGETYYWRVAGVNNVNNVVIDDGNPPWSFTTWLAEPNLIVGPPLDPTSPAIFGQDSVIRLERWVKDKPGYIVVDMLGPPSAGGDREIPGWLSDPCDADRTLRAAVSRETCRGRGGSRGFGIITPRCQASRVRHCQSRNVRLLDGATTFSGRTTQATRDSIFRFSSGLLTMSANSVSSLKRAPITRRQTG